MHYKQLVYFMYINWPC